jgi:hypothetical protein
VTTDSTWAEALDMAVMSALSPPAPLGSLALNTITQGSEASPASSAASGLGRGVCSVMGRVKSGAQERAAAVTHGENQRTRATAGAVWLYTIIAF